MAARDRLTSAWWWLFSGAGIVVTMLSIMLGFSGMAVIVAYWAGGPIILVAVQRLVLQPRMEARYPLSRSRRERRALGRGHVGVAATPAETGVLR